ncbi:MAG: peptidoglycan DD-metalloendopeptidase family protein [Tunicatimonas sp.]
MPNNQRIGEQELLHHRTTFHPVISALRRDNLVPLDLTASNESLASVDLTDTAAFDAWIQQQRQGNIGIGGYLEDRVVYRRSNHYAGDDPRSLHLGLDLWTDAGTPVYAPLPGTVHSMADNAGFGNYGPTMIIEHQLDGLNFYTLYGHLSQDSLARISVGQSVAAGAVVGEIGPYPENGDWPPHLHLQLITDRLDREQSDYAGVVAPAQRSDYATRCPDPRALLVILD